MTKKVLTNLRAQAGYSLIEVMVASSLANWLFLKMDTRHVLPASGGQADDAACIISAVITGRSLLTCMGQAV